MRAYDISLFTFCLAAAIALLGPTRIFGEGPSGTSLVTVYTVAIIAAILAAGGISFFGTSFRLTAALTAFAELYGASCAMLITLLWQFLTFDGATTIVGTITAILVFIGIWGAWQTSKGPMGPEE